MIVDDEPLAVKLLESFVAKTPDLELLGSFTDSVEAINAVKERKPNLLFLDIQMPDLNGMELAHMIPEGTRIIFTTAFKEYAFESYEVKALDFLLKPIRYNKFIAAVDKGREWFFSRNEKCGMWNVECGMRNVECGMRNVECGMRNENTSADESGDNSNLIPHSTFHIPQSPTPSPLPRKLFLKVDGEYRQIAISDIMYVSGMKDYVMFYLVDTRKPLITHLTMKAVEEMLPQEQFMRVHRSYIVALDKIRKVDRNDCIYIGEEIIHVTDAFLPQFQNYLKRMII
jgi:DNA-binding LytR/AlgR family response regulator